MPADDEIVFEKNQTYQVHRYFFADRSIAGTRGPISRQ